MTLVQGEFEAVSLGVTAVLILLGLSCRIKRFKSDIILGLCIEYVRMDIGLIANLFLQAQFPGIRGFRLQGRIGEILGAASVCKTVYLIQDRRVEGFAIGNIGIGIVIKCVVYRELRGEFIIGSRTEGLCILAGILVVASYFL